MLTFHHSPQSRSTTVLSLVEEMGIADRIKIDVVSIPRIDGSGRRDPKNPHPEGKVPALSHNGQVITERGAIMAYLAAIFPEAGMAPPVATPAWGAFLSWMTWYNGVMEPVLICEAAGVSHPYLTAAIRGHAEVAARINAALSRGPWLMGETFSAADILVHSPYAFFKDAIPDDPLIRDWVARCIDRPAARRAISRDAAWSAEAAAA